MRLYTEDERTFGIRVFIERNLKGGGDYQRLT